MTFFEARALGMHVRRSSWSDPNQWFIIWRGVWWYFTTGVMRPVIATDYTSAELLASDWTTVPQALAACAIDPTIGSTGGTSDFGTLAGVIGGSNGTGNANSVVGSNYGGGGGLGSGGGPQQLPPAPSSDVSVTFNGITQSAPSMAYTSGINVNGTWTLAKSGLNYWTTTFTSGNSTFVGDTGPIVWLIEAYRSSSDPTTATWSVDMHAQPARSGLDEAYETPFAGMHRATPTTSALAAGTFTGGTCTVN